MSENSDTKVGFIGLGAMGTPMAQNIKKAGYNVTIFNRDKSKAEFLGEQGLTVASSAAEAAQDAGFVITMLADDKAIKDVMFGEQGVLKAMPKGATYINMSTTSPELAHELEAEGQQHGVRVLAAPVLGSTKPATDGTLIILVDGDKATFEKAEPLLKTMGQTIHYLGATGNALEMKLISNAFIQIQLAAFGELLALGQKAGLDREQLIEILTGGAGASGFIKLKAGNVSRHDYSPAFSLKLTRKDIGLAAAEMRRYNVPGLVTTATEQLYALATQLGRNEEDMSVIVPLVAKLAGLE